MFSFRQNECENAIDLFDQAIQLNPYYASAYNSKAISLDKLKRHEEALVCYDKALELEPTNAAMLTNKGVCLNNLKRKSEAIECLNKALDLEPQDVDAFLIKQHLVFNSSTTATPKI